MEITNIQRLSLHDGPGIRTTVFLKGCSLHCYWCHNPETIHVGKELEWIQAQCIGCGECRRVCPSRVRYRMPGCTNCFACAETCPAQALRYVSRSWHQEDLATELLKDAPYFHESGGGLTFSGGEPLLQWRALQSLLPVLRKNGVHIAVDTAGNVPWEHISAVISHVDLFLYDIKSADSQKHQKATGASNNRILQNLRRICGCGKRVWIRIPLIPGLNCSDEDIGGIAEAIKACGPVEKIELLPFHGLGAGKYKRIGIDNPVKELIPPSAHEISSIRRILQGYKLPVW